MRLPVWLISDDEIAYKYCWLWKFLITWSVGFSISYYPDYEECKAEISIERKHRKLVLRHWLA